MTDYHIRQSIDQIIPEPPDGPPDEPPTPADDAIREALANYAHEAGSGWMNYLLSLSTVNEDGTWTIPATSAERWYRQMTTPYHLLPGNEQESDRAEADRMLHIFESSRAVALLRACERLEKHQASVGTCYMPDGWVAVTPPFELRRDTLADALIALAARVERRSEGE